MQKLILVFFVLLAIKAKGQNILGKVIDETTGQTIPFVSVAISGTKTSSVTNENGDFIIKATSLPVKLKFSHVSYNAIEFEISKQESNLIIKLKPAAITLLEVSVDPYAGQKLLKLAFAKAEENKNVHHYLKTFYRQLSTINGTPTQIHEIFYDLKWNPVKTNGWLAQQTRFAETKEKPKFSLSNQSYFTFVSSGYLSSSKKEDHVNATNVAKYDIEVENYIAQSGQDIAVITCKFKKPKKNQYYVNAKYFIGVDDHKVYRLENQIFNLPLSFTGDISLKYPPIASTVATFKNNGDPINVLESISTKLYLSVNIGNPLSTSVQNLQYNINSLLTTIAEDESLKTFIFSSVAKSVQDKIVVESIKYNPEFWKNNPIVKQTALEDKFIKMMESQNAFGTMINP